VTADHQIKAINLGCQWACTAIINNLTLTLHFSITPMLTRSFLTYLLTLPGSRFSFYCAMKAED